MIRLSRGFTLIELLIVIAIIAVLALIAVPNFLEAQVRAQVSRCRADLRSLATALENYGIDHAAYPPVYDTGGSGYTYFPPNRALNQLTTPVSYILTAPRDPFNLNQHDDDPWTYRGQGYLYVEKNSYNIVSLEHGWAGPPGGWQWRCGPGWQGYLWLLQSAGPDRLMNWETGSGADQGLEYAPSNGTVSAGDITWKGP